MNNIEQKMMKFVSKNVSGGNVGLEDNLFELGLVHSLFAMQIILFIEKEFNVELEDDDLDFEKLQNIKMICELVDERTGK